MNHYFPFFSVARPDSEVFTPGNFRSLNPDSFRMEIPGSTPPHGRLCQIYTGVTEEEAKCWTPLLTKVVASVDLSGDYARVVRKDMGNPDLQHINAFGMVVPKTLAHNNTVYTQDLTVLESLCARDDFSHPLEGKLLASQFLRIIALTLNMELDTFLDFEFYQATDGDVPAAFDIVPNPEDMSAEIEGSFVLSPEGKKDEVYVYTPTGHVFGPYPVSWEKSDVRSAAHTALKDYVQQQLALTLAELSNEKLIDLLHEAMESFTELTLGIVDEL